MTQYETFTRLVKENRTVAEIADGNVTVTGKTQKKIIRDCLAGENDRTKVEGWLSGYMAFPFKSYTKNGGIAIHDAWSRVRGLF